jgi:hypothetical protein
MEFDVVSLISDGGALGLLALVIVLINKHFTRLMNKHDEDRSAWLSAIQSIILKLGLIERDLSDIDQDVSEIKKDIIIIKEKI